MKTELEHQVTTLLIMSSVVILTIGLASTSTRTRSETSEGSLWNIFETWAEKAAKPDDVPNITAGHEMIPIFH